MATQLKESTIPQNLSVQFGSIGWDVVPDDSVWLVRTLITGITDALNMFKNKSNPVVILVQDLKGNRVVYACVEFIHADSEDETSEGNWSYYWSYDCENDDIPENATVYTIDQQSVQKIIADRAYNLCKMTFPDMTYISQLAVYVFRCIKDTLDQQDVHEGESWTVEQEGVFEASVEVKKGVKEFSLLPKGELKMLIKDDAAIESK